MATIPKQPRTGSTIDKIRQLQEPYRGRRTTGSSIDITPKGRSNG